MVRVAINGINLNYDEQGQGEPLVLIHGLGGNAGAWGRQIDAFSQRHRVLAYDQRGFGDSDKPEGEYSFELFSHDLYRLLRMLGVKRVVVVGQSLGGMVAQRFAIDHGEMVKALILCDTTARFPEAMQKEVLGWARAVETEGMAGVLRVRRRGPASTAFATSHPEAMAQMAQRTLANVPTVYAAVARLAASVDFVNELPGLSCPTLVVVGADDAQMPPALSQQLAEAIPGARLVIIPGAGHIAHQEQPEVFNQIVLSFLAEVCQNRS